MKIRRFKDSDEAVVRPWYESKGEHVPADWMRGPIGFIVEDEKPLACGWLLATNAGVCFGEYYQTNNKAPIIKQARALTFMARSIRDVARGLGFKAIIGLVEDEHYSLHKFYEKEGAVPSKKRFKLFYKGL